jgi:hypothetical protein
MRRLILIAAFAVLMPGPANAAAWVAVCFGRDVQYTQDIGGVGYFHVGIGDGTYETQRLIQTYYDGNIVCAAADPKAQQISVQIGQICADKTRKVVTADFRSQAHTGPSKDAQIYCDARVTVH